MTGLDERKSTRNKSAGQSFKALIVRPFKKDPTLKLC